MQIQLQGLHPLYKSKDAQLYAIQCSKCFSVKHFESSDTVFLFWKQLSHPRVMKSLSLSCFITERITVFMSFSFEKLRSLDADVMGAVKIK